MAFIKEPEYDQILVNNRIFIINKADIYLEKKGKIYCLFADLLNDIRDNDEFDTESVNYYLSEDGDITCCSCGEKQKASAFISIADEFYFFISNYIKYRINELAIKMLNISLKDAHIGFDQKLFNFIEILPDEYNDEKKYFKKLIDIRYKLPIVGGSGGPEDILNWIIDQTKSEVFGLLFSYVLANGLLKGKKLFQDYSLKTKIKKSIAEAKDIWKEVEFDDLLKNIEFPEDFKGSKEEIIEKIVEEKANAYRKELIEVVRKQNQTKT